MDRATKLQRSNDLLKVTELVGGETLGKNTQLLLISLSQAVSKSCLDLLVYTNHREREDQLT